jgi:hypothetical protein
MKWHDETENNALGGRFRLAGPINRDVLSITLSEGLPKRTSGSGIPSVVQGLHKLQITFDNRLRVHERGLLSNCALSFLKEVILLKIARSPPCNECVG